MENSRLSSLIIFSACSIIKDNSKELNYLYKKQSIKINNIKNKPKVISLIKNIKEIRKDLFK